MKINSPYIEYVSKEGHPGVKTRKWHPIIFIPRLVYWIQYWKGIFDRYKSYEKTLREIYELDKADILTKRGFITIAKGKIEHVNCGYDCNFDGKFGFVPEDGCPIHDI